MVEKSYTLQDYGVSKVGGVIDIVLSEAILACSVLLFIALGECSLLPSPSYFLAES
jgi:hypothetical protein